MRRCVSMLLLKSFNPDPRLRREADALTQAGYEVTIFAWKYRGGYPNTEGYGYQIHHLGPSVPRIRVPILSHFLFLLCLLAFNLRVLLECLQRRSYIYHCHDLTTLHLGVFLKWIKGGCLIYDSHERYPQLLASWSSTLGYLSRLWERLLCWKVDSIITTNRQIADALIRIRPPVTVVSNYVDLDWFDRVVAIDVPLSEKPIVLYQGIFKARRGIEQLVQAMELVRSDAVLLLLGSGPLQEKLEILASVSTSRLVVVSQVHQDLVPAYIRKSLIGVNLLLSGFHHDYGTPNKLYEYMAGRLPVLVSGVFEMKQVVEEGNCGFVVDPYNIQEVAQKIDLILSDDALRKKMGERGRQQVELRYNWRTQIPPLLSVYSNLCKGSETNGIPRSF